MLEIYNNNKYEIFNKEHMNIKTKFYINGSWVNPFHPNELEVINPSNEEVCATISLGTQADTDSAVKAARDAFIPWWKASKEENLNY